MKNQKTLTICWLALGLCLVAQADDYYLLPDATDWAQAASYTNSAGGTPSAPPGSSDRVFLPVAKACSFTAGTVSFNTFANVDQVVPAKAGGDTVEITVASGTNQLNCSITRYGMDGTAYDVYDTCTVTKKGAGALELTSVRKHNDAANIGWDYLCSFIVEAGDLIVQQTGLMSTAYAGGITVNAGARLLLGPTADTSYFSTGLAPLGGLHGAGLVTNANSAASVMRIASCGRDGEREDVPFSGMICGNVYLASPAVDLTGTESTFTGRAVASFDFSSMPAERFGMKIRKFGKKGEPSSIGSGDFVGTGFHGGRLIYTGEGEECDKKFYFDSVYNSGKAPLSVDAGPHGGLRFTGTWAGKATYSTARKLMNRLVLEGSNTVPSVIAAPINSWHYSQDTLWLSFHILKRGTGTWELSGNAKNSSNAGTITVEEGTLRYDSLAEIGEACALGTATNLREFATGPADDLARIPYAMILGGEGKTGKLEYVGAEKVVNSTRLIGLAGTGVLASTNANIELSGVTSVGAGSRTLVLHSGRAGGMDVLNSVTNGAGTVSVVKTGTGNWMLAGDLSFSGELAVSNGSLTVRAPDAKYTWFRMTIKGCSTNTLGAVYYPRLYELALYDKQGIRQNIGLQCNRSLSGTDNIYTTMLDDPEDLEPGYFMFGVKGSVSYWKTNTEGLDRDMTAIFSDTGSSTASQIKDIYPQYTDYCPYSQGWNWTVRTSGTLPVPVPEFANPDTWLPITMRLTNGVPEIAAYDLVGYTPGGASAITNWTFEGSVDGRNWVNLTNVDFSAESTALGSSTWYSTKLMTSIPKRTLQAGEGFPLPGRGTAGAVQPLANVSSVFVAPGAKLVADGAVTISKLAAACAGAEKGTLRGFTLAPTGTLDVRGDFDGRTKLALVFEDVEGVENLANWAVTSGGTPRNNLKVSVKDGEVLVTKVGLVVTIL